MALVQTLPSSVVAPSRHTYADNLKVVLVIGVIVAHATIAWTGVGDWVFEETPLREPLLSVIIMVEVIGALFAIPLFFLLAGMFTPRSLQRKGLRRFLADRYLRLGIPMLFFVIFLSPIIEYVDPGNSGWDRGFLAFVPEIWWPPAPGPTWFLGVLLLFSTVYAVIRTILPPKAAPGVPRLWQLGVTAGSLALVGYIVRLSVPFGEEVWRLALGQAPAWAAGFTLGAIGGERAWFTPVDPGIARIARRVAWSTMAACVVVIGTASAMGADIDDYTGGGTWQSVIMSAAEGLIVVGASLWMIDLFQRRFDRQGPLGHRLSRAAFAAFVLHQLVLVGLVLLSRQVALPPEVEYVAVATLGVVVSFAFADAVIRIPGVSRVV